MRQTFLRKLALGFFALLCSSSMASAVPGAFHNTPGNFLIFPKFDIRADRKTQIRIVNNATTPVSVKLDYICPGIKHVNEFCSTLDRVVTFTPYQTQVIDVASHNPPCAQGYVVAYPVTDITKLPIHHPYIYGSYHLIDGRRHEANNAITTAANVAPVNNIQKTPLLLTDFQATANGGTAGSRVVLLDLNVIPGMQNPPAVAFIDFWNSAEEPFSTSHEFICWSEVQLDEVDANFRSENLGTEYGSMAIEPRATCPIPGTCPPNKPHLPNMFGTIEQFDDGARATRTLHNQRLLHLDP